MCVCVRLLWKSFLSHKVSIKWTHLLNIKIETRAATQARDQNKSWLQWGWQLMWPEGSHWTWMTASMGWQAQSKHSGSRVTSHLRHSHRMPRVLGRRVLIGGQLFPVSSFCSCSDGWFYWHRILLRCPVWPSTSRVSLPSAQATGAHSHFSNLNCELNSL